MRKCVVVYVREEEPPLAEETAIREALAAFNLIAVFPSVIVVEAEEVSVKKVVEGFPDWRYIPGTLQEAINRYTWNPE